MIGGYVRQISLGADHFAATSCPNNALAAKTVGKSLKACQCALS
jgi:hypothetical protein